MRKTTGWTVAALVVAAGCGGPSGQSSTQTAQDEHQGPDVRCGQCAVTGGGQLVLGGQPVQFAIEAIPVSGPGAGPGFGGAGVAAKGHVQLQVVPKSMAGLDVRGDVDTILSCTREGGVLRAEVSGTVPGNGRFTAVVTDGGEPAHDTLALSDPATVPATDVANGNLQIHGLDRCEAPCGEGLCLCPEDHVTCEACHAPPAPPVCLEGTCLSAATNTCEPCQSAPPPPPPAPPLPL